MPLLGLPLPSRSLAIRDHSSRVKSGCRAVIARARSAVRALAAAADSGFHLQPLSQLRIRMMPVNRLEVQEALSPTALKPLVLVTQAAGIRKDWRHLVEFAGGVDRLSHGCGLWPNSSGIAGDSSLSIPCLGIPASR